MTTRKSLKSVIAATKKTAPRNEYTAFSTEDLIAIEGQRNPGIPVEQNERLQKMLQTREAFQLWIDSKPGLRQALNLLWSHSPDDGDMTDHHEGAERAVEQINQLTTKQERNYICRNSIWEDLEIPQD